MEDDEAETSTLGDPEAMEAGDEASQQKSEAAANVAKSAGKKARKSRKQSAKKTGKDQAVEPSTQSQRPTFEVMADTEAMLNGLNIGEQAAAQDVVDFESMDHTIPTAASHATTVVPLTGYSQSPVERQRRDHEEYRKKRDTDPAFIPNRGNFFMHDTRSHHAQTGPPTRGAWNVRGRGRGAGSMGPPFPSAHHTAPADRSAEQTWKHDLHDTINEEPGKDASNLAKPADSPQDRNESARLFPKAAATIQAKHQQQPRVLSFSRTAVVGKVQIRVFLSTMREPITFSEVPWKQYTRLPDHRPPLRRDKPVRISLPPRIQRYIFPAPERSFIFIPRQMRPNQQGFGRSGYQRSIGGYGYSSRRTSMYGGSVYAGSVAASRRSSFASVARENAFSPVGSAYAGGMPPSRPIVRLPHGSHSHFPASNTPMGPFSGHQTPTGYQVHSYPLPSQPAFQGTPTTTVHQPRPQKVVSVTGIESPAVLQNASVPPEAQQPFQNQLPAHMNEQSTFGPPAGAYYSPGQQYSYQPQPAAGTPLSNIPEQAMHAPNFQPQMMPYGATPYYAPYPPQQGYYFQPGPPAYPSMPVYGAPQQGYMLSPPGAPMAPPQAPPPQPQSQPVETEQQVQRQPAQGSSEEIVAYERDGTTHYLPASEARRRREAEDYQPARSFVPTNALVGMPPPTPAPETGFYYSQMQPAYYPAQTPLQ
ncbi:hypothetical protein DOTSEDRAFT_42620 [Dothistroma septosporum NZE10]|uniref:Btz domain-containing protein n=1 Tax=Dothistroma septosporum (strain NZE10 / CBS 128990) TaxID=675120 RepID=N1PRG5_DOTSN|nr:hypothetical protein DOTSEDRAFT_42620 [Dothistroma septosporum NZE10]